MKRVVNNRSKEPVVEETEIEELDPIRDPNSFIYDRISKYKIMSRLLGLILVLPYLVIVISISFYSNINATASVELLWNSGLIAVLGMIIVVAGNEGVTTISDLIIKRGK